MEPDDGRERGVSHARGLRGAWRSLASGRGGAASQMAQPGPHTVDDVGAGDQRRPFAELSPQEQAERRREAARKAAATRARNRARQAAQATAQAQAAAQATPEPVDVAPVQVEPDANVETGSPIEAQDASVEVESPTADEADVVVEHVQSAEPVSEPEPEPVAEPEPVPEPEPVAEPEPEPEHVEVVGVQSADDERVGSTAASTEATEATEPAVVLRLAGVTRRFGSTLAVDDVHLEVRAGECYGIVGPNGAGKSTTVSLAGGLMRPSSGTVEVGGADVRSRGAQRLLGVVPDRMRLFDRLTGRQLLVHAALLRRVPRKDAIVRAATLLERFDLAPDADRLVSDYSIGMQQLVGIAAALIHAPRVVVLDEPFESIDPVATDTIVSILGDLRRRGGAVVLTSHDMALVERTCDHVVVLQDGVVRASGPIDDVRDGLSLEDRFTRLVGSSPHQELPWLSPSLD